MSQTTQKGMVAHWSFDEGNGKSVEDVVSGIHDPIDYVFNEAKYQKPSDPQWRDGILGKALLFDGYSTFVTRSAQSIQTPTSAITIEAWVAPRCFGGIDDDQLSAIVNQHNRDLKQGFILGMYKHGSWSFQFGVNGEWIEIWSIDNPLPEKEWSHIAATYDSEEATVHLYLNGQEVSKKTLSYSVPLTPSKEDLIIGKNNYGKPVGEKFTLNMFNGLIDEVSIYKRAVTQEEINDHISAVLCFYGGLIPAIKDEVLQFDRALYDQDRHRPQYHVTAPGHWMNEPHAPIYFNGQYHLFYQHNPQGPYWGYLHWGHWVSEDMVHWRDLPIALTPEKEAVDPDGDWSGSACYDENGVPALFFTAGNKDWIPDQMTGLARSTYIEDGDNNLTNWVKHPEPITLQPKGEGLLKDDFRDPFVWKEEDTWYQIVGTGIEGRGGTATVFTSRDLLNWEYRGFLYEANHEKYPYIGPIWELPVLLPLGKGKHIFIISPVGEGADVEVYYWIGEWNKETCRFMPDFEEPKLIDVGDFHFTGPSGMIDPRTGRVIIFTIAQGERTTQAEYDAGWAHNGGLPVSLSLRDDGELEVEPIEELETLREDRILSLRDKRIEEVNQALADIKGDMLEIKLTFERGTANKYGIYVRQSPDRSEETLVYYNNQDTTFQVDRSKTTLDPGEITQGVQGKEVKIDNEDITLRVFLDRSMIEAYLNKRKSLTTRAYPLQEDAIGLSLYGDESVNVKSIDIWTMKGIHS
ncbi:GH32 C-terminal domain-containing protein [Pontibacillus sp. ALD_SL1]|uniref:LamG-like jellyroll fold domain-containing protein n=1 Tax=Pontibacillus sp. ALD_SL1 TaxID=2777185 RepID=UPI001A96819E|nr:GH32 C-terminal domain-containing protein [Pontibacillus sp. ALD_SL1]QSS98785.1 GH32 C-terminal domain-containing protein [Pontibacillus sp. ALD_SL1]